MAKHTMKTMNAMKAKKDTEKRTKAMKAMKAKKIRHDKVPGSKYRFIEMVDPRDRKLTGT